MITTLHQQIGQLDVLKVNNNGQVHYFMRRVKPVEVITAQDIIDSIEKEVNN